MHFLTCTTTQEHDWLVNIEKECRDNFSPFENTRRMSRTPFWIRSLRSVCVIWINHEGDLILEKRRLFPSRFIILYPNVSNNKIAKVELDRNGLRWLCNWWRYLVKSLSRIIDLSFENNIYKSNRGSSLAIKIIRLALELEMLLDLWF